MKDPLLENFRRLFANFDLLTEVQNDDRDHFTRQLQELFRRVGVLEQLQSRETLGGVIAGRVVNEARP